MPSIDGHQKTSYHFYRTGHANPALTFAVLSLLLLAPHAYAAQVEQVPQAQAPHKLGPVFTLGEQIRYMQAKDATTLAKLTLDGHIQPVADYLDRFADKFQTFEREHERVASVAIPGMIIGLKSLYSALIGLTVTKSWQGAGIYAFRGAAKAGIDEAKGAIAHECLDDIIDPVIQYGIEHFASQLMKRDSTLKQQSAERLASWIAAGVLLNSYEFKHFAKYMRTADFKSLKCTGSITY